jgi:hypothetical protein
MPHPLHALARRSRRLLAVAAIFCLGLSDSGLAQVAASATAVDSSTATAAYLLNFLRFTEWPPEPGASDIAAPYVIGVAGNRHLLDSLITLVEGRTVRGHPLRVTRIKDARNALGCHVVYLEGEKIGDDYLLSPDEVVPLLQGRPVLTVSNAPGFVARGGLVQLFREGTQLRFAINTDALPATGLALNSRLLALSRKPPAAP